MERETHHLHHHHKAQAAVVIQALRVQEPAAAVVVHQVLQVVLRPVTMQPAVEPVHPQALQDHQ